MNLSLNLIFVASKSKSKEPLSDESKKSKRASVADSKKSDKNKELKPDTTQTSGMDVPDQKIITIHESQRDKSSKDSAKESTSANSTIAAPVNIAFLKTLASSVANTAVPPPSGASTPAQTAVSPAPGTDNAPATPELPPPNTESDPLPSGEASAPAAIDVDPVANSGAPSNVPAEPPATAGPTPTKPDAPANDGTAPN